MRVRIYSPQGVIYDHQALSCSVRAVDGGLTVLPNHTPILAPLELSVVKVVRVHEGLTDDFIAINGGVLEMRNNEVEIIISKNRHGGILAERCSVNMATSKFTDLVTF